MKITLENIGKKFSKEWIFRNIDFSFEKNNFYHISGSNGAGKSTLLQLVAGKITPSEGEIIYIDSNDKKIEQQNFYQYISFVSPYLRIPEEMTLTELLKFYSAFKEMKYPISDILVKTDIKLPPNKAIKLFSSGMKQRVKIMLALFSKAPVVMLDEPISNLDASGIAWYKNTIEAEKHDKLILVCSNNIYDEHFFCNKTLEIMKKA